MVGSDTNALADFLATLQPDRPLLLVDADEVLLRFVERLEVYLLSQGKELRLTSFQLSGNIYDIASGAKPDHHEVRGLIAGFFDACADDVPAVDGAANALKHLSQNYQIAILSNIPAACRARRETSLRAQGLAYPVIANRGDKGPVAARLAAATSAPVVFIDDLPPQHQSVAAHAPDIHRVHFVADPRLAKMIAKAEHAHVRFDDWVKLSTHLIDLLKG